jgi:hypothetical protein
MFPAARQDFSGPGSVTPRALVVQATLSISPIRRMSMLGPPESVNS